MTVTKERASSPCGQGSAIEKLRVPNNQPFACSSSPTTKSEPHLRDRHGELTEIDHLDAVTIPICGDGSDWPNLQPEAILAQCLPSADNDKDGTEEGDGERDSALPIAACELGQQDAKIIPERIEIASLVAIARRREHQSDVDSCALEICELCSIPVTLEACS